MYKIKKSNGLLFIWFIFIRRYYDCRLYNQISKLSGKKKMINQYYIQSLASFSFFFFQILPFIVWGLIRYRCQMIYAR
ncbi:uncharacterized protein BX664DRAFT_387841 [Halteromyces radiatus]|uniref:uncharacterized protein n=1 Tax=Halteromyces radiatus TaxID=101107 RepID=UPI0022203C81|nr:uncharacterized protein BX664DRAFT_387841 [Halteromyces radiatus]KAI8085218.1 hypothetical protein BX664DRAFT_387841 [Halteromyces radiatus]